MNGQKAHKIMLNLLSDQGNANQNHIEIQVKNKSKTPMIAYAGEDVE